MLCHHFQNLQFVYIPKVFAFPIKGSINFNTTPQEQQFASMPCLGTFQERGASGDIGHKSTKMHNQTNKRTLMHRAKNENTKTQRNTNSAKLHKYTEPVVKRGIALCVYPHCKVSIRQYTKMCTVPLIFFQFHSFRWQIFEEIIWLLSLSLYICHLSHEQS